MLRVANIQVFGDMQTPYLRKPPSQLCPSGCQTTFIMFWKIVVFNSKKYFGLDFLPDCVKNLKSHIKVFWTLNLISCRKPTAFISSRKVAFQKSSIPWHCSIQNWVPVSFSNDWLRRQLILKSNCTIFYSGHEATDEKIKLQKTQNWTFLTEKALAFANFKVYMPPVVLF